MFWNPKVAQEVVGNPRKSQGSPGIPRSSQEVPGIPRKSPRSQEVPRDSQQVPGIPRKSQGFPNINSVFTIFLLKLVFLSTKKLKKPRKAQKAPGSPGKARKPRDCQRSLGASSWTPWTFLGLVPSLGLHGFPGHPRSLDFLGSREVRGSTGFNLSRHPSRAFQKVVGPPERGCKGASIKGASIRGFY